MDYPEERLRALAYGLAFAVGLIAIYWPALGGAYLWDDDTHYTANRVLEAGGLVRAWMGEGQPNYWPLTWTSFWLEHRLFGFDSTISHVINVGLHATCGALFWLVLHRLRFPLPMVAALLFILHPTQVETVAWVTQRKTLLSAGFALVACLGFIAQERGSGVRGAAMGWGGFLASLLSKGAAVGLPIVFAAVIYWRRRAIDRDGLRLLAPYFGLAILFTAVELVFMHEVRADEAVFEVGLAGRVELVARNLSFYVVQALLPLESIFVQPRWVIGKYGWLEVVPAFGLGLAAVAAFALDRRVIFVGLVGFVAMLGPILGFADAYFFKYSYVADHYLYLALPFAALGIAALLSRLPARAPEVCAVVLCGVMAAASYERSGMYRDDETLWRATLAANDDAWIAHNVLGVIEQRRGDLTQARAHFEASLALEPPSYDAALTELNLGNVEMLLGDPAAARTHFERTLEVLPHSTQAWTNLAAAHLALDDRASADAVLRRALERAEDRARIQNHLDVSNELERRSDEASAQ